MPKTITDLALMFGAIGVIALLVSNAQGTKNAIQGSGMAFAGLLKTVTLENRG